MRALAFMAAVAIALAAAPVAAADILGTAQVRTADGKLLAAAGDGSFTYPADGSVLTIGKVEATETRVDLEDVSMLGGRVHADRVTIRHGRRAAISGLVVQGLLRDASANALFQLDTGSYLVVSQKAVIGKKTGYVGLRLSVAAGYPGVARGAQVLVGLRERGSVSTKQLANRVVTAAGPWAALGFGAAPSIAGLPVVTEPLLNGILPPANGVGGRAVAIAAQYLGVPYRWGGASPLTGFDCSGLTMFVYAQLGVALTHYTGAQLHEGTPVPPEALQPGDLVFFDAGAFGIPGHEGMYVGGGLFIHAPHTGDVVKISTLSQYAGRYVGAVRPYA
ncbi:MAG: NlpC/P60 family protein [Actinobacteria bacterium]|nr:MAG: NlpC/P60 family protein [Actinomycetota bacterium]